MATTSIQSPDSPPPTDPRGPERRVHRRLTFRWPVELRDPTDAGGTVLRGVSSNISSGGLCIELDAAPYSPGDRLHVAITIPPSDGVFPVEGRAACIAEVARAERMTSPEGEGRSWQLLAMRFLDRLRLSC